MVKLEMLKQAVSVVACISMPTLHKIMLARHEQLAGISICNVNDSLP